MLLVLQIKKKKLVFIIQAKRKVSSDGRVKENNELGPTSRKKV